MAGPPKVKVSGSFVAMMHMAERLGVKDMHRMKRCWELQVDEHWWIAVNGKPIAIKCSKGQEISPYHMYVEYDGNVAGLVNVKLGKFVAYKDANEKAFIDACGRVP